MSQRVSLYVSNCTCCDNNIINSDFYNSEIPHIDSEDCTEYRNREGMPFLLLVISKLLPRFQTSC